VSFDVRNHDVMNEVPDQVTSQVPSQKQNALDMATSSMNNAVQSRDYLLLYNTIYNTGIPASILAKLSKSDRIAVIAAETDNHTYANFMHLFVSALNRNLINSGYQVVDFRTADRDFGIDEGRLRHSIDKLLVFTVWEAGSRSIYSSRKSSVFSAFQINMDVVETKNNVMLASVPVFGSDRNEFDKKDFDNFQIFTLNTVNADLPLLGGGTHNRGAINEEVSKEREIKEVGGKGGGINLQDVASHQERDFLLKVYNPGKVPIYMEVEDINGTILLKKDLNFESPPVGVNYSIVWDGILANGLPIQDGRYSIHLKNSKGKIISTKRFTVR
jgi:hypothetical protein